MIAIPKKYILGTDIKHGYPSLCVAAPESRPELYGFVLYIPKDFVIFLDDYIFPLRGNVKDGGEYFYMFEYSEEKRNHRSPRYRYTEDQMIKMYGTENIKFLDRTKIATSEPRMGGEESDKNKPKPCTGQQISPICYIPDIKE